MASPVTLASLKEQARQRADQVNSGFIQDPELVGYINASAKELYDRLLAAYGEDYYTKIAPTIITSTINQDTYALPADFYKLVGVDKDNGGGQFFTLKPFMFSERNKYKEPFYAFSSILSTYMYRIINNSIKFIPVPSTNTVFRIWYAPIMTTLVLDADTFDGINGWEEYIVIDAAIKMMQKEESDVSILGTQKNFIIDRLNTMATNRDIGMPMRVSDVRRDQYSGPGNGFWGV